MIEADRQLLQEVMTNRGWEALERYMKEYIGSLELSGSIKKDTEFNTIWDRAHNEGGRDHLTNFFLQAEGEAKKL